MNDIENRTIKPNPDANFTPTPSAYKEMQPFRFWCQTVLPSIYDDSLSYYELLSKVVQGLNVMIENLEGMHVDVTNLHTAYTQLQSYVNNYFKNLDVQDEINKKLDLLVTNGTLNNMLVNIYGDKGNITIVNSINEMNDKSKLYALNNDTNGFIYYWGGNSFITSGIKIGSLSGYLYSGYNTVNSENITSLLQDNKLSRAPINSFLVISRNVIELIDDFPDNFPIDSAWLITLYGANNVLQYLFSSKTGVGIYYRTIYTYTSDNQQINKWENVENSNNTLKTDYPTVSANTIDSLLTNRESNRAPANSMLIFGSAAIALTKNLPEDLPNDIFYLITLANGGNALQYLFSARQNYSVYHRVIISFTSETQNVGKWTRGASYSDVSDLSNKIDQFKLETLKTNYSTVSANTIDSLLTNRESNRAPANSMLIFGSAAIALTKNLPEDLPNDIFYLITLANGGNALQYLFSARQNYSVYHRVIISFTSETQNVGKWTRGASYSNVENKDFPVINENTIDTVLTNNSLLSAPKNSLLVFTKTALDLIEDIPIKNIDSAWLITNGRENNVIQFIICRKSNSNAGFFYRSIYSYSTDNPTATNWLSSDNNYTISKWCFFGDSLCFRENTGYGFPSNLGIIDYVNNGKHQATMRYNENSIPLQVETQINSGGDFDAIIIEGGYNDWYSNSNFGEVPSVIPKSEGEINKNTTCGGLVYSIYKLINSYPKAKIYFLAVHKIRNAQLEPNESGWTQDKIMESLISICKLFGVEVIDCYHESGLNTYYEAQKIFTTNNDGVHPTVEGFQRFYYPVIKKHIYHMYV